MRNKIRNRPSIFFIGHIAIDTIIRFQKKHKPSLGGSVSFGSLSLSSYTNDIKIIQGKVIPSWWRKSGHQVNIDDIQDIIDAKPNILVLGKGKPGMMKSTPSLREFLKQNDIELVEEKTSKAIKRLERA